jgi:hypothetical protein
MRKLIFILPFIPFTFLAQDTKVMTVPDALINAVLTNTAHYLEHRKDIDPAEHLELKTKQDSIDWNNKQLIKWQIIEPKDSVKIVYDD